MKAIRVPNFGGISVLKFIENVPIPVPEKNQVLIKVHSVGVNPVDTYIREGAHARCKNLKLPYTPGSDCSGCVVQYDSIEGDNKLKVDQRVYTCGAISGTYAEYALASRDSVHALHPRLTFDQGAAIGVPYYTAYRALVLKGNIKSSDTVLIHGASGAVGLACCQIASHLGAKVFGTAGTVAGLELIKQNGASMAFNHREENYQSQILAANDGVGVNLIIEMLANVNLLKDCEMSSSDGRIMVVGSRGGLRFDPRLTMGNEIMIQGISLFHGLQSDFKVTSEFLYDFFDKSKFVPVIDKKYSLQDAATAHHDIIKSTGALGKLIITVNS